MTKTNKTNNGRKVSTLVKGSTYELSFSRPVKGVKSESTHLNVTGFNPATGEVNKVRLDGRAVAALRRVIAK
jgi:hypothetical protein